MIIKHINAMETELPACHSLTQRSDLIPHPPKCLTPVICLTRFYSSFMSQLKCCFLWEALLRPSSIHNALLYIIYYVIIACLCHCFPPQTVNA